MNFDFFKYLIMEIYYLSESIFDMPCTYYKEVALQFKNVIPCSCELSMLLKRNMIF